MKTDREIKIEESHKVTGEIVDFLNTKFDLNVIQTLTVACGLLTSTIDSVASFYKMDNEGKNKLIDYVGKIIKTNVKNVT